MSYKSLICISILLSSVIIIGSLSMYFSQKRENSLYNKITILIENNNLKKMINILSVSTLIIVSILLGLELSVFCPSVEWAWVDRSTLITTFATILGGFFGFISAAIGIIGTYGAFYLGANKEKEKEEIFKKTMLFNLLEVTINRTSYIVKQLGDMSNNYGINVYCDEEVVVCEKVREIMLKVSKNEYDDMFRFSIGGILDGGSRISLLPINKYGNRLQEEFNDLIKQENLNLSVIIYDGNWVSYLDCLKKSKDIQNVINWLNLLRSNSVGNNVVEFLNYRNDIIKLIDDNEPSVKDGSIRGVMERGRKVAEMYDLDEDF